MRVGVIGIGDIATKAYLPVLASWPNIELVLCSRNSDSLIKAQNAFRIKDVTNDYKKLIKNNIDVVMVHAATEAHYEITEYFLKNKIPVFVDKPLSSDIDEVRFLCNLAKTMNTPLFIGFNRRYVPIYQHVFSVSPNEVTYKKNRQDLAGPIRGFIYDDFIHVVDTVMMFSRLGARGVPDITVHGVQSDGVLSSVQVSWQSRSAIFTAKMNRESGSTAECLQVVENKREWKIDNLVEGKNWYGSEIFLLANSPWENHLRTRGFHCMLDDFFKVAKQPVNPNLTNSYLVTHEVCEAIVKKLLIAGNESFRGKLGSAE